MSEQLNDKRAAEKMDGAWSYLGWLEQNIYQGLAQIMVCRIQVDADSYLDAD